MASTSCNARAARLLSLCVAGEPWPRDLVAALAAECPDALFRIVAEGLSDRFEPALCETYAEVFAEAIAAVTAGVDAAALVERYRRVRRPRRCDAEPGTVFVLSRVTLGADMAVTSVVLEAVCRRFPNARICFAGPRKNWELFAGRPGLVHVPMPYARGTLAERLAPWPEMRRLLSAPDAIVVDPDSRLTQVGLLPVCPEERYWLFESRAYGTETGLALPELTARWTHEVFGVEASPWLQPDEQAPAVPPDTIAISLGVGENAAKRIADPFEGELISHLVAATGGALWIDAGAGGEEAARVERAISGMPETRVRLWRGSFAGFAGIIARSSLYIGYDSAGQHAAAAAGVPVLCIFAGYPNARMFARWRPTGRGPIEIVRVEDPDPAAVLQEAKRALARLLRHSRRD